MKFCDERIQKHLLNGGKIKRKSDNFPVFLNDNNGLLSYQSDGYARTSCINKKDLTADDWEILEPEYDWNRIIKDKVLCVFWDYGDIITVGTLKYVDDRNKFVSREYFSHFDYCKPFNPAEFNIAKNLKEYEK